ncbi:hypothetical protein [Streptomyces sp. Ac-502]|uniref:hypothetical protein n=1 Tax=Streptomyces sp. Ac-502 TaxID=3342801 RepID=UPI003862AA97
MRPHDLFPDDLVYAHDAERLTGVPQTVIRKWASRGRIQRFQGDGRPTGPSLNVYPAPPDAKGAHGRRRLPARLYNDSCDPIARYLIRVSVDRYPGNPERSNQHYRENPLIWEEMGLSASMGGEPIGWRVQHDCDAFKELWALFENENGCYPLYPGESAWLEYSYTVSDEKWGTWFRRAVRLPAQRLGVRLDFPAELDPIVWGTETTMTAAAFPFENPIRSAAEGDRRVFSWSTEDPPLHAWYRLEWKFRARPTEEPALTATEDTASARMAARSRRSSTSNTRVA